MKLFEWNCITLPKKFVNIGIVMDKIQKLKRLDFLKISQEIWGKQAGAELCQAQSSPQLNLASYKLRSLQLKSSNQH